jgi:hypothetical protein
VTFDVDGNRVRTFPLPTGEIFVSGNSGGQISVWRPSPAINDLWRPVLSSVSPVIFGNVRVDGFQLNGLTTGGDMGDDGKMATNYPLASLRRSGQVMYVRTHDFSQMTPTPGASGSFYFDAPVSSVAATYDVYISVGGLESLVHGVFETPYIDIGPALYSALDI